MADPTPYDRNAGPSDPPKPQFKYEELPENQQSPPAEVVRSFPNAMARYLNRFSDNRIHELSDEELGMCYGWLSLWLVRVNASIDERAIPGGK